MANLNPQLLLRVSYRGSQVVPLGLLQEKLTSRFIARMLGVGSIGGAVARFQEM